MAKNIDHVFQPTIGWSSPRRALRLHVTWSNRPWSLVLLSSLWLGMEVRFAMCFCERNCSLSYSTLGGYREPFWSFPAPMSSDNIGTSLDRPVMILSYSGYSKRMASRSSEDSLYSRHKWNIEQRCTARPFFKVFAWKLSITDKSIFRTSADRWASCSWLRAVSRKDLYRFVTELT